MISPPHPLLRAWRAEDLEALADMHADPDVSYWLGGGFDRARMEHLHAMLKLELESQGWGVWAVCDRDGAFAGAAGLRTIHPDLPFAGVEALWRLKRSAWGKGLVSEVMPPVLASGFEALGLHEVLAFTAASNARSQSVMARLGFARAPELDFDNPKLAEGHPLKPHVVYRLKRPGNP